jgi:hypothetical protein
LVERDALALSLTKCLSGYPHFVIHHRTWHGIPPNSTPVSTGESLYSMGTGCGAPGPAWLSTTREALYTMGILCGTVWAHSAGPGPSLAVDDDHVGVGGV